MKEHIRKFKSGDIVAEVESTDKMMVVGYITVGNEFFYHFYGRHANEPLPEKVVCKWLDKHDKEKLAEFDEDKIYLLPSHAS